MVPYFSQGTFCGILLDMIPVQPQSLSDHELKESYWLVTHAPALRTWAIRMFIAIDALLLLVFLIPFGGYIYYALTREALVVEPLRDIAVKSYPKLSLEQPRIVASGAINRGTGAYDLYALVEHTQDRWRADADVIFSIRGVDQPPVPIMLFPNDRKYALKLGMASSDVSTISARLERVAWKRLSAGEQQELTARGTISVSPVTIVPSRGGSVGTQAQFVLENKSVYHLYDFRVAVVLMHGATPVAATYVPVFELKRHERATLEARWSYAVAATGSEVVMDIDLLDTARVIPAL